MVSWRRLPDPPVFPVLTSSHSYLAFTRLAGPDWLLASLLPGPQLCHQALDSARWVLWAGLGALALTFPILFVILRHQIARPWPSRWE